VKIVDLKLTPVSCPTPATLRWGRRVTDTVGGIIVQVITDGGIVGLGEFEAPYEVIVQECAQFRVEGYRAIKLRVGLGQVGLDGAGNMSKDVQIVAALSLRKDLGRALSSTRAPWPGIAWRRK
jgi:L-alanine-DL-glutamate epimerase-like enolase superfamily enzyme